MALQDKRNVRSTTIEIENAYGVIENVKFIKNNSIDIQIVWYKNKGESDNNMPELCKENISITRDIIEDNNGVSNSINVVLNALYRIVKQNERYTNALDV